MSIHTHYLEQGSQEWAEHRSKHFNASEAGSVMGVSPWKPKNMTELLQVRRGELVIAQTDAMTRGNQLEPVARDLAEQELGITFTPTTMTRGCYSASLDGLCFEGRHALEIKCPMSADSKLFGIKQTADLKAVAPHYWYQLVHQAWVSGVDSIAFAVYHPSRNIHIGEVSRDELAGDFDALLEQWEIFGKHLDEGTSPETERTDADWLAEAAAYREELAAFKRAEEALERRKANLFALGGGVGGGIKVTRVKGRESVKYAEALKELAPGADLAKWTSVGKPTWKIVEMK